MTHSERHATVIFQKVRNAIAGRFQSSQKQENTRLKQGAKLFVDQYAETMKMLAKESKED